MAEAQVDCLCCMETITPEIICRYKSKKCSEWKQAMYCCICTQVILGSQYHTFMKQIELAAAGSPEACKKAIRTMIERGSPIYLSDKNAFPVDDDDEVSVLFYGSDGAERSAKLDGALEGAAHKEQWDFYKEFLPGLQAQSSED